MLLIVVPTSSKIIDYVPHRMHSYFTTFLNLYMCFRLTWCSWWTMFRFYISPNQMTPLHRAAVGGHVDTVQYLIKAGSDIHSKAVDGVRD